ncbi:MAG TPA: DUF357 domain-containing protein, partial [Methanoregula sp.]|nr:DUF357 domain-containing protein [Methanoregula sp.]
MNIRKCQQHLAGGLGTVRFTAPESSLLGRTARTIHAMASAYESDGLAFCASGDLVNGLACFFYGFGWLHFGYAFGVFGPPVEAACPFMGECDALPSEYREKLEEKTRRYCRLLDTARSSVAPGPDPATSAFVFSEQVLCIAWLYARQGSVFLDSGRFEDALACFSYGHGWLDAAVTAGLYRITAERDLFTV